MKNKTHKLARVHFKINLKVFWTLSILLTVSLIGVLIFQTQLLAQRSEFVFSSQRALSEFSGEDNGHVFLLSLGETSELAQLAQNLNFEKIDKVRYINVIESTVLAEQ
jgi:hypothetical protein